MPAEVPLDMPAQDLSHAPQAEPLPGDGWRVVLARVFVFGFAGGITLALAAVFWDWFRMAGLAATELALIGFGMFTAFWIALSVATALLGCLPRRRAEPPAGALDIAVLVPIYGEPVVEVLGALNTLMAGLSAQNSGHRFTAYVLSDTRDPAKILAEAQAMATLGADHHHRHRAQNTRFKAGNIQDWVMRWGGRHEAMLVLDADSVMRPAAVIRLADEMAAQPRLGLVQTIPQLIGGRTLFARMQAFANTVYGTTLARGLTLWSGSAANFWGHNALIRTRAFAAAAGLPDLPGRRPFGGVILSHDFVEAALLRRAGWDVRFLPEAEGSFEATPPSVIAHIARDRRWCQGNLQHLRVLGAAGLHPISRMHMLHGAMAYVTSLAWFALMVLWVLVGSGQGDGVIQYFNSANPLFPAWPEMDVVSKILIVALIYGMLVAPKVLGAVRFVIGQRGWTPARAGGFGVSFLADVVLSVLMAPMLMVQHMIAVLRTVAGVDTGWTPPGEGRTGVPTYLRFHALELVLGFAMLSLAIVGMLTVWLLPIAVSLALAPVLSAAMSASPGWAMRVFRTPQDAGLVPPPRELEVEVDLGRGMPAAPLRGARARA